MVNATSQDDIYVGKRGLKMCLMTWRALSISPYGEGATATAHLCLDLAEAWTDG
jgi:hypothetical protein